MRPGIDASIEAAVNNAVAKLTEAGAVLVPFDSSPLDQANVAAAEPRAYEQGDALSRQAHLATMEPVIACPFV